MNTLLRRLCLLTMLAPVSLVAAEGTPAMQVVRTPIRSYRLLAMSMDDEGYIWTSSIHRMVHRYDPRTGHVKDVPLPYDAVISACICAGEKVYLLGQAYPQLIIYDRKRSQFRQVPYGSAKPDVWYGVGPIGRWIYLFDRGSAGVIKWDTHSDSGQVIAWPYANVPLPSFGSTHEADEKALWCRSWDYANGQYVPAGVARLDLNTSSYTGFWHFPKNEQDLQPHSDAPTTLFLPHTLKGKLVPFDVKEKRWARFIDVPGFGQTFGFIGGSVEHEGWHYFSLSTYDGDDIGCDGKPYHFVNGLLAFEPKRRTFTFPTLDAGDGGYYQVAYMLSAGGQFFASATNIREPNGALSRDRKGEVVFWQTRAPAARALTREPVAQREAKPQRPVIRKLGTIDPDLVETTPVVVGGKLWRFEWVRKGYWDNRRGKDYFRFRDSSSGAVTDAFADDHEFGSAFVEGDSVYVTGTKGRSSVNLFVSKDLENWEMRPLIDDKRYGIFNTSMAKAGEEYVLAFEIDRPKEETGFPFTIRFARSKDLRTWQITPPQCNFTKERYSAAPCLRYDAGWYYLFYLEEHQGYETRVVRSKDLVHWQPSPLNPVLRASEQDQLIANPKLGDVQKEKIRTARNINNSDLDFCEWQGRLIINYSWGNQQGVEFLAEAVFEGNEREFLRGWFPEE